MAGVENFLAECRELVDKNGLKTSSSDFAHLLTDERGIYTGSAVCLISPKTTEETAGIVRSAITNKIGLVPIGGNTGLVGGATPPAEGSNALISMSRMRKIKDLDKTNLTICVEAGLTVAEVGEAASKEGLYFPLRFGSEGTAQIGGAIATNAGGYSTLKFGNTRELLLGVEAVLADASLIENLSGLRKDNRGYSLTSLLCGSEGTLGIITAATLKLSPKPVQTATALTAPESIKAALILLEMLRQESDNKLSAFEWMNPTAIETSTLKENIRDPYDASGKELVLVELISSSSSIDLKAELLAVLGKATSRGLIWDALIAESEKQRQDFWELREAVPEGEKLSGGSTKHDISVPLSAIEEFLTTANARFKNEKICAYGHLGDGNLHYNLLVPAADPRSAELTQQVFDLVQEYGGSFSAEHGIGQLRSQDLERRISPGSLQAMKKLKQALDPEGILNPGKLV